uniref:Uncharacterized protein n=5 Tax=Oryza TaxID=4527 RepID=A0A0D3G6G2_9ORYZ
MRRKPQPSRVPHPNPSDPASASNFVSSPAACADPHPASRGGARRPPSSFHRIVARRMAAHNTSMTCEGDYETEQKKQAAADVLFHYSQFVMVCIGEGVRPTDLRLHLMKEVSGMATSLTKEPQQAAASPDSSEPSSSGTTK